MSSRSSAAACHAIEALPELRALVRRAIVDEPPVQVGRGALVREGYDAEVDRLRGIRTDGKGWMMEFEASERRRTGIANLKIGYNKVFGYYIKVTRTGLARVPADYARKQTIANGERYVTEELKRRESDLLGAEERLASLESHLFADLVATAAKSLREMRATASALAGLDASAAFAETACKSAAAKDPESSITHSTMGELYLVTSKWEASEAEFRRALELRGGGNSTEICRQ